MPYFEHDGLSFHYTEAGEGTPFIFQHGLGGDVQQILKIYSPPSGVRLITSDFRGHGKTPVGGKNRLSFNTLADDMLALMHHLQLNRAIIGGISMGAAVSLNFTLRYPAHVLGLILSRPAWLDGPMEQNVRELFAFIARLIREHGPATGRQLFMDSEVYLQLYKTSPVTAQSFLVHFNYEKASETAVKLERLPEDAPNNNRINWKKITVPVLILANKSDPVHPFEYGLTYAANISHAAFKEITPKSVNEEQHHKEVQENIDLFISDLLNRYNTS